MARHRTILLVDDDPNVLALLQAALRLQGHRVVCKDDPVEALSYLKHNVPDLLISDTDLPHFDGFEFIRRVQGSTRAAYAPFIFIGEETEPEKAARGLRMGAREFLRKPFTVDELLVRVDKVFAAVDSARTATPQHELEGTLEHFPFPVLAQFLARQRLTGRLTISLPFEPVEGIVLFRDGTVEHSVFGRLKGRAALLQLMLGDDGAFAFSSEHEPDRLVVTVTRPLAAIFDEGQALLEVGKLRRIDVVNRAACRTFIRLIETPDEDSVILLTDRVAPVAVLSRDLNRPSGGRVSDIDDISETYDDFVSDVEDSDSFERWSSSDSLVLEAEEGYVTESTVLVPANTLYPMDEPVGGRSSEERLSISGDFSSLERENPATQSIIVPSYRVSGEISAELEASSETSTELSEDEASGVALVELGPGPLERLFKALQAELLVDDGARGVIDFQISTWSGRSLVSTVDERRRRDMLATFTAQASQFAQRTDEGLITQVSAGDLHLVVMELPHKRMLTGLFDSPPDVDSFRRVVQGIVADIG
jgi:CheY-like chemotaxis protein